MSIGWEGSVERHRVAEAVPRRCWRGPMRDTLVELARPALAVAAQVLAVRGALGWSTVAALEAALVAPEIPENLALKPREGTT